MNLDTVLPWAAQRKHATLITIRADGRPQSSDIVYRLDGTKFEISLTADRAKTVNIRRDPRVVLHISEPASWSYISLDGACVSCSCADAGERFHPPNHLQTTTWEDPRASVNPDVEDSLSVMIWR